MYNKFKVKKKIISIALALAMTASSVANLPMNVFAGTVYPGKRKSAATKAPHVVYDFDIKNVIELRPGEMFNVNEHVKNIRPQGATVSYTVESQTVFAAGDDQWLEVISDKGQVRKPGIARVRVEVGDVYKYTYIVAGSESIEESMISTFPGSESRISTFPGADGILRDSFCVASDACFPLLDAPPAPAPALYAARNVVKAAVKEEFRPWSLYCPHLPSFALGYARTVVEKAVDAAADVTVGDDARAYAIAVKSAIRKLEIDDAFNVFDAFANAVVKTSLSSAGDRRLKAVYAALKVCKKLRDIKEFDLEAKLKSAYMVYRLAESFWNHSEKPGRRAWYCQMRANALQEVIDACYSDKVGDIAERMAKI